MLLNLFFKCFLLLLILYTIKIQSVDDPSDTSHLQCYVGQKVQYWNEEWVENLMSIRCSLSYCSNMTIVHTDRNEEMKIIIEYSCGTDTLNFCENISNKCLNAGVQNITTCCCNTDLCNSSKITTFSFILLILIFLTNAYILKI
uniref:UPAR/Ly6 domain-containing protein n=1 Tax=Strongyloides stercoralis TaxID=6248 RepID=A0A0K0E1W3_STRER